MWIRKLQFLFAMFSATALFGACAATNVDSDEVDQSDEEEDIGEAQGALPSQSCVIMYYDAPNGNVVGICRSSCSGGKRCSGTKTAYYDQDCEPCSGGGGDPGNVGCYTSWGYCSAEYSSCVWC